MKKIIMSLLATVGLMTATTAMAGTAVVSGETIQPDDTGCVLLGDVVRLNLSNSVHGAYNCDELTNTIQIGACHEAGSRAETTVGCEVIDSSTDPVTYNDSSCGSSGDSFSFIDYRGYFATSSGGSVAPGQLGGNCTDDLIAGHENVN